MTTYKESVKEYEAVQWDGATVDPIIALVGLENVLLSAGKLGVNTVHVPPSYWVVVDSETSELVEVISDESFSATYEEVI